MVTVIFVCCEVKSHNYSICDKPRLKFNVCQEQTDVLVCSHSAASDDQLHCVLYSYLQKFKFS